LIIFVLPSNNQNQKLDDSISVVEPAATASLPITQTPKPVMQPQPHIPEKKTMKKAVYDSPASASAPTPSPMPPRPSRPSKFMATPVPQPALQYEPTAGETRMMKRVEEDIDNWLV